MRRFPLFAECLTAGLLVVLAALPLVTLLPALAAGCAHVKAHVDGETTAVRAFLVRLRAASRGGAGPSVGVLLGFGVLAADVVVVRRVDLHGGGAVGAVCAAAAVALAVVVLRAAADWSPGSAWSALVRGAARRAVADAAGSLLLVVALGVLVVVTWQLPPLVVPMLGCVLMAAVAVERRRARGELHR
ncbi:hypothetical protein [Umezawaea sp.]|uniref:hypothetical protein n=1 Tax=Umezawaea sp. TaxID=1955258 RepID=UPI002ED3409B